MGFRMSNGNVDQRPKRWSYNMQRPARTSKGWCNTASLRPSFLDRVFQTTS